MKDDFYLIVTNYLEVGSCPDAQSCPVSKEVIEKFKDWLKAVPRKKVDMTYVTHYFMKDMRLAAETAETDDEAVRFYKYAEDAGRELEEKGGEDFWEVYDLEAMSVDDYDEFMGECMLPDSFGLSGDILSFEIYKVYQDDHETL